MHIIFPKTAFAKSLERHATLSAKQRNKKRVGKYLNLEYLGWDSFFAEHYAAYQDKTMLAGRVTMEHKHLYQIKTALGEFVAIVSGKMRHLAQSRQDFPAVGDWVVWSPMDDQKRGIINAILPRRSKFSRKAAGSAIEEQIVATNVDTIFLLNALNNDFNLRRIERYLIMAWESGAFPVIVFTKSDLCEDVDAIIRQTEAVAPGVPIMAISSLMQEGMDALQPYLNKGQTIALLGSSGVGKSTLVNYLVGESLQKVKEIRQGDDHGKHTTTYRELFVMPNGAIMIDTPGMRELQLWHGGEGLQNQFDEVESVKS
jgi:ribosome biogenesis GTPase / thiamine phosphate phosphatase